jgi:type I restriction enzyme S subunit
MKKGWQTKTLDQISTNLDSRRVPITKGVREGGEYPYYGASGIVDYVADYIFDEDALLISEDGANLLARSTPIAFPASGKYWVNNHAHIVKFESLTTQRFVELYLESIPLDDYITGAAQPKLNQKALNSIPIPAPPLAEQQRIVGLLDEAFEGLATAKANAEKNLQNARALFESHLQSVFTQRGPGWVEKNLGDLCQIKTGKKDVNEGNPDGKYPFFTCAAAHTFSDNYSFDTEALLVAGNGNVGQVSYYSGKFEAYQRTYVLFDFKDVTAKYLFRVLDKRLSATVSKQKLGNTMPYIKIGMLTDFVVPVPPPKEQELVAESLGAIAEETQRLARLYERKHAALEALKKSLLHQAFTGAL